MGIYTPCISAQNGAWEPLVEIFKRTVLGIAKFSQITPNLVELQTCIANTTRLVNSRLLTPLFDDTKDNTAILPSSLLTPGFHPHTPIGTPTTKIIYAEIFDLINAARYMSPAGRTLKE